MTLAVHPDAETLRAMRRLRAALEKRVAADAKAERRAARVTVPRAPLAQYDFAALGRLLRPKLERDGRGWAALAAEMGVTSPDLSRIMAGQAVSAPKIFAVCDWAKVNPRRFYRPPFSTSRAASRAKPAGAEPAPVPDPGTARRTSDGGPSASDGANGFTGKALKRRGKR